MLAHLKYSPLISASQIDFKITIAVLNTTKINAVILEPENFKSFSVSHLRKWFTVYLFAVHVRVHAVNMTKSSGNRENFTDGTTVSVISLISKLKRVGMRVPNSEEHNFLIKKV